MRLANKELKGIGFPIKESRAERVGFEPTVGKSDTRSPGAPDRPLQHLSTICVGQVIKSMVFSFGGEGGIRTHARQRRDRFSRAAPSTTRTPLLASDFTSKPPLRARLPTFTSEPQSLWSHVKDFVGVFINLTTTPSLLKERGVEFAEANPSGVMTTIWLIVQLNMPEVYGTVICHLVSAGGI